MYIWELILSELFFKQAEVYNKKKKRKKKPSIRIAVSYAQKYFMSEAGFSPYRLRTVAPNLT